MQKRKNFLPVFVLLFVISLILFFLSIAGLLNGLTGFIEQGSVPLQRLVFGFVRNRQDPSEASNLRLENAKLTEELAKKESVENEIGALRDQFRTTNPPTSNLLPAKVVGLTSDKITIDKGQEDGVEKGDVIVLKDNLIGRIIRVSKRVSTAELITSPNFSLTAKGKNSESLGVIKGSENGILLNNVVLSEKLLKGDLVMTKGNIDERGLGIPPDLIIGKVISVNKKASSLFQTAEVKSLFDFSTLETVFIIVE